MDTITGFERKVVFRVARGYFFAMAVGAVLLFLAGGVFVVRSLAKPTIRPPATLVPPKPRSALSYGQVAEFMRAAEEERKTKTNRSLEQGEASKSTSSSRARPAENPYQARFAEIEKKLRALFNDPAYTWADEVESVCTEPTSFGCLHRENRLKRRGVVGAINAAVADVETVDERIRLLEVLITVLDQTPMQKRGEAIIPIVELEKGRVRSDQEAMRKHEAQVSEQQARFHAEVEANDAKHRQWWQWGLYGLGSGFSLLIAVSLFLAFLSMERHTRAIEHLVGHLGGGAGAEGGSLARAMPKLPPPVPR